MNHIPFKGLVPYSEEDASFFFGRDKICGIINENLQAQRLTLLSGVSGVGKSSLLRAGVAPALRRLAAAGRGTPELYVVVFSAWRDEPISSLLNCVRSALQSSDEDQLRIDEQLQLSNLEAWANQLNADLLVVLDQFEEFFLLLTEEEIMRAMLWMIERAHTLAEPAGAASLAAAYHLRKKLSSKKVGIICSGGNTSVEHLRLALAQQSHYTQHEKL